MKIATTYTIQELLSKHPHNQDLQKIDWTKKKDDVEFDLSSILGGDWSVHKKNKTVTELWLICPPSTSILLSVMKIKDLINELSKFNPESTLLFSNNIECFHSMSGCSFLASHQLQDFTEKEFKKEVKESMFNSDFIEDEKEYKKDIIDEVDKNGVVVFQVSGEENWNQ